MKHTRKILPLLAVVKIFVGVEASAQLPAAKTAGCINCLAAFAKFSGHLKSPNIYIMSPSGSVNQITHDGMPKALPVISPDGGIVAYSGVKEPGKAAATIWFIDLHGRQLAKAYIEPEQSKIGYAGLERVARIGWLGSQGHRLFVTGPINPTQNVTYFIDVPSHLLNVQSAGYLPVDLPVKDVNVLDDAQSLAFSPNGKHVAAVSGIPHFNLYQAAILIPKLILDGTETALRSRPYQFTSPFAWSQDSRNLAVIVRDSTPEAPLSLVIASTSSPDSPQQRFKLTTISLSKTAVVPTSGNYHIAWQDNRIYLGSGGYSPSDKSAVWMIDWQHSREALKAEKDVTIPDVYVDASNKREALFGNLLAGEAVGVADADIWCKGDDCGSVAVRPRAFPDEPLSMFDPLQD